MPTIKIGTVLVLLKMYKNCKNEEHGDENH